MGRAKGARPSAGVSAIRRGNDAAHSNEQAIQLVHCAGPCGLSKDLEEFPFRNKEKGVRNTRCKMCVRAASKDHYRANTQSYLARAEAQRAKRRNATARRRHSNPIPFEALEQLIVNGMSSTDMASKLHVSPADVRYWLK